MNRCRSSSQRVTRSGLLASALLCLVSGQAWARGIHVLTFHGDAARLGWNRRETALTLATVQTRQFGKLWETHLDGQVYGSPLHVSGLDIGGERDVVFAATENNSVYAIDAASGQVLWGPKTLAPSMNEAQFNDCNNIRPRHGITSTPFIDLKRKTIFVCGVTQPGIRQVYQVWGLDLQTGAVKPGWPVTLKGSYKGLLFDGGQLTQRGALHLVKGWLYIPFGSRCDIGEWHGWIMGVNTDNPSAPQRAFTPAPTVDGGGIWGGGGVSADKEGNLYCVTGNGGYNLDKGGSDVCESILRLAPRGDQLVFELRSRDYYVPSNYQALDAADVDMGGSSAILLPDQPGMKTPRLVVTCGKDGLFYVVNRYHLGGLGGEIQKQRVFGDERTRYHSNIKSTPAYFDGGSAGRFVYISGNETGPNGEAGIVALKIGTENGSTGGKAKLTVAWTLPQPLNQPGAPTVSSNGDKDGIVWLIESNKDDGDLGPPGVLYAFDAVTGKRLYHSNEDATRDVLGDARKFSCPTVANGRVFVGTDGVAAYGLLREKPGGSDR
jgi:outer membrane protein assembly factor BamB